MLFAAARVSQLFPNTLHVTLQAAVAAALLLAVLNYLPPADTASSALWGRNGEKWRGAGGPLPDFSFAGAPPWCIICSSSRAAWLLG